MHARLKIVSGPTAGRNIGLVRGKNLVGRDSDCQCRLDDPSVSRRHCVLTFEQNALRIRDLDSRNGTFVNHVRIGSDEVELADRDLISAGDWSARIDFKGAGDPESNPDEFAATAKFVLNDERQQQSDETVFDAPPPRSATADDHH